MWQNLFTIGKKYYLILKFIKITILSNPNFLFKCVPKNVVKIEKGLKFIKRLKLFIKILKIISNCYINFEK